ncbi:hypothetical protein [Nostoc sp.]|uniref:hypothetical protein n=1 Tax=Nostoc sp. TaxID=1180 RepID=UPI003592F8A9
MSQIEELKFTLDSSVQPKFKHYLDILDSLVGLLILLILFVRSRSLAKLIIQS